jgi:metal-responsive CopG/Arc/MetJ family transcriptional regulator
MPRKKSTSERKKVMAFAIPANLYRELEREAKKKHKYNRSRALSAILHDFFKKQPEESHENHD